MTTQTQFDVVIIGSGAGGGASAWALANKGVKVLVLEAGPHYDPEQDYRLHSPEWELQGFPDKLDKTRRYSFARLQTLDRKYDHLRSWNHISGRAVPGRVRRPGQYSHVQGVGGTTLHFTGEAHRLHPDSMNMKSRFGVGADWPVDYQTLEPYYQQVEEFVGVAGPANQTARVRVNPFPQPVHSLSYASQQLARAGQSIGMRWEPNSLAVLSQAKDTRPGCNYCGQCQRGCPRRDKGSVDVTFLPAAVKSGHCTIRARCQVNRLVADDKKHVTAVEFLNEQGVAETVTGKIVMVACGAIETPRLLLNSRSGTIPDGIGNESRQVGRHFMETLAWSSAGLHAENLGSHRGLPADGICWDFNAPDAIPGGVIGGMRLSTFTLENDFAGPVNYATRVVKGWGVEHKRQMKQQLGHVIAIGAIGESLPHKDSYISLDRRQRDALGRPLAQIHSFLDDMAVQRLAFMAQKSRATLKAMGVKSLIEETSTYDIFHSTHVFGTCRMGLDPTQSVVNDHCQHHHWKNLYIVDASVFPSTGGGEAPSLTIEALALRTAEHIHAQLTS